MGKSLKGSQKNSFKSFWFEPATKTRVFKMFRAHKLPGYKHIYDSPEDLSKVRRGGEDQACQTIATTDYTEFSQSFFEDRNAETARMEVRLLQLLY